MAAPDPSTPVIFDRVAVRRHRERAARQPATGGDRVLREIAGRLVDRLADTTRRFPLALNLGCRDDLAAGRGGIDVLVNCDLAPAMAVRAGRPAVVADEEVLPFRAGSFDLVLSLLNLHWTNDLPGALIQIARALKPDGLFLAALWGGETLVELRQAMTRAEAEIRGGASPRVSPFVDIRDAGQLLQRAGFALPVVDSDRLCVHYPDPVTLMHDVRAWGETNALAARERRPLRRQVLTRAGEIYGRDFAAPDGRVRATFQIVYLTGWRPDPGQPRPLRPGSAATRLADALGGEEIGAGEAAGRRLKSD